MRTIAVLSWMGLGLGICACMLSVGEPDAAAAERASADVPTPQQDDAQIHDLQFLGSKIGWAVGEHGAIWQTNDAGREWKFKAAPVNESLRSVCFLSDRIGWIVGGGSLPYAKASKGTVLFTSDGGATWQQLAGEQNLPELQRVKFFSMEVGIAAGQSNAEFPSGVLVTDDGGRTWRNLPGDGALGWRAADFLRPDFGAVAGPQGRRAIIGESRLIVPRLADLGLNGIHALKLQAKEKGWLVGDGGLVLCTSNSGSGWESPPAMLPEAVADIFDFRAVCFRGKRGWIAGQPGSVIWHTPDGGESWQAQRTHQSLPLSTLAFTSDLDGWAAGAMGTMLHTTDGGKTWLIVRGKDRRAAFLALHGRADQVSFPLVSTLAGEQGYRGVVALLPRRDVGPDGHTALDLDLRLQEAVNLSGGSQAEVAWRFPISIAGLDRNSEKLIEDWNRRTEGKLAQTMMGQLVSQIRMWRPSIVIIDKPAAGDALTKLMHDAIRKAVEEAADPRRNVELSNVADLAPWQVGKLYARLSPGSSGSATIDPDEYLPRAGASAHVASAPAAARLFAQVNASTKPEAYALLEHHLTDALANANLGKFFVGLDLAPGSGARRKLPPITNTDVEAQMKLAQRQKHFHGILDEFFGDQRMASQMVGQLPKILAGLPPEQAALQLAQLAELYRRSGQWDLAESTMLELVTSYEHEPAARDAMRWLLQIWSSSEAAHRRLQLLGRTRRQTTTDFERLHARIRRATDPYNGNAKRKNDPSLEDSDGVKQAGGTSLLRDKVVDASFQGDRNLKSVTLREWHDSAREMAEVLERTSPAFFRSPQIQFPRAALARQKRQHAIASEIYHKIADGDGKGPWQKTAAAELWLQHPIELPPKGMIVCRATDERPWLDGSLTDPCWENADEIPLTADDENPADAESHAFVMLSYDQENLYLAASFPRAAGVPGDLPGKSTRRHDADLSLFDRLTLMLDIDRDYVTAHRFSIDQRGLTAEDTCEDATWNPQWFAAAAGDKESWCVEAAIPFSILCSEPPQRNQVWAASLVRTIPAVGIESWTHPGSTVPRLEAGGMIRFD